MLCLKDRKWHNPSRTSSDGQGYLLERSCLSVGKSKTRRTLHQQLTIIYCSMFRLHTVAQERKKICKGLWTDTKRHHPSPTELFKCKLLTAPTDNWLTTFSKFANSYISKFRISVEWCHLAKLLHHLTHVPNSLFLFSPTKPVTRYESFCLHFGLPVLVVSVLAWTFQFHLHFCSKILANRETHSPTKPDNKIINYHGNWVIEASSKETCFHHYYL